MITPERINRFLDANLHRFDLGVQYLGDEPNAERRPFDTATARWCLLASWPYEAAAGNQSIPAVYRAIHDGNPTFLCDRFYLPATPRDLKLLDKAGIGVFGIETKHPITDFDVVATSISYPVLSMSFVKMLTMSGIPARWRDRDPNTHPFVVAGGLSYGAPEVLAPVVDCWWLGEVEDEPGNPGVGAVTARIAAYKRLGRWTTDRLGCYAALAREFDFLYFPRFIDVHYGREVREVREVDRQQPSKQVIGYTSNLDGMVLPRRKRHVKNLDAIKPLDNPPLLYADPAMGSGDLEVGRGCPAWCSFCALCLSGSTEIVTRKGVHQLRDLVGQDVEVWTEKGWQLARVDEYGKAALNRITFVPADIGGFGAADTCAYGHPRTGDVATGGHQTGRTSKLTMEKAEEIRCRFAAGGITQTALAREYGVAAPQISLLLRGKAWVPNVAKPAVMSDGQCRTCRRIKARNAYYRKTGQLDLVVPLKRVVGWRRERGWRQLPRPSVTVTHEATATHRWPLVDGSETHHLAVGDVVRAAAVTEVTSTDMLDVGFIHGLIFGDGTEARRTRAGRVFSIGLFGDKDAQHLPRLEKYFEPGKNYSPDPVIGISVRTIDDARPSGLNGIARREVRLVTDIAMKDFPPPDATPDYIRGFLEGWIAADGTSSDGPFSVELTSQLPAARAWLDRYASTAGWLLIGDYTDGGYTTNLGTRRHPLHKFTLSRNSKAGWKVISIENGRDHLPVYCATVPGEGFFTLASGVYTGNTYRQKPYRQRSVPYTVEYAKTLQNNMGSTRMAPFMPDLPMHTQRRRLIADLLEQVSDEVDAPTMRVDDYLADEQFILLQVHGGMDTVTLGVEGNSQRMRDLVGKGTSDDDIKEAVTRGIAAGIRKFKLYMISNLPGEDEGDVYRILKLAKDLADIRESMNQPTVRIQFSWTPLMVEANTPMQWFAPQPGSRILGDVWEEFRDLKIDFKLGAKGETNKAAFFQLCQRASRDVGEALVDAMLDVDQACWGGVPRTFKDLIESKLHEHGFANGYADCFDERFKHDMFGWEFIDQGISTELMWNTYVQMREFAEHTESHSYDRNFTSDYHGNEWVSRCDERCHGKTCGACDYTDLKHRTGYIRAAAGDRDVDLSTLRSVDQRSQAVRIRVRLYKPSQYRFVGNDHWRFNLRRAAFRAQADLGTVHGISKRSIRFASDEVKFRDWTSGIDYAEFALTRPADDAALQQFLDAMNVHLNPWMRIGPWQRRRTDTVTIRADVANTYYELLIEDDYETVLNQYAKWTAAAEVPMRLKIEGGYFAPSSELVNAKDYVDDLWVVRGGRELFMRMLLRGRPNPYNLYAAVMGKPSWLDAARFPATRLDAFVATDRSQQDFWRPACISCGLLIPVNLLDQPYHPDYCPRCHDAQRGLIIEEMNPL